jgi:hypothetical protein
MNRRLFWLAMFGIAATAATVQAFAHEAPSGWRYDPICCNARDCAQINSEAVEITAEGYRVTLHAGEHPMVTSSVVHVVAWDKVRVSQDGEYHACLFPGQNTMRCFYAPPPGS